MPEKLIDFARFRRERQARREPVVITDEHGEQYELPGSMPASIMLEITALMREYGEDLDVSKAPPTILYTMLLDLFGTEQMKRFLRNNQVTDEELGDLFAYIMEIYTAQEAELAGEDGEGNGGKRPKRTRSTS